MSMDKKLKISLILFLFSFVFVSFALYKDKRNRQLEDESQTNSSSALVFYYGDECPHCKTVEEYMAQNKISDKLSFEKKEIFHNEKNKNELIAVAKSCGLIGDSVGVPFLKNGSECLMGPEKIIDFFKQKINEK